jgi:hypothetical protein
MCSSTGLSKAEWCVECLWFMHLKDPLESFEKSRGVSGLYGGKPQWHTLHSRKEGSPPPPLAEIRGTYMYMWSPILNDPCIVGNYFNILTSFSSKKNLIHWLHIYLFQGKLGQLQVLVMQLLQERNRLHTYHQNHTHDASMTANHYPTTDAYPNQKLSFGANLDSSQLDGMFPLLKFPVNHSPVVF